MDLEQYLIDDIAANKAYYFESANAGNIESKTIVSTLDYILQVMASYHETYDWGDYHTPSMVENVA